LILFLASGACFGRDVVNLANGKTLSGEIIDETDTEVRLLIDDIEIPVSKKNIVSIVQDGKLRPVNQAPVESATGEENPPPVYRTEPTPTPPDVGLPVIPEVTGPSTVEESGFPYPGREPLIPILLPLGRFRVVTGSVVNLRSGPGTNHSLVAALPKDTILLEEDEEDNWIRVVTERGEKGWIAAEYTEGADAVVAVSTGNRLNVRAGPSVRQAVIGQIDRGDPVILIETKDGWGHIRYAEGSYGWVSSKYLEELQDLRMVRPAIAEMGPAAAASFLEKGFSSQWSGEEGSDWKHLTLTLGNDALVRNGVGVIMFLWNSPPPPSVGSREIVRSDDIVSREYATTRAQFEDLGFSLALRDTTNAALVIYLRGKDAGDAWKLEMDVLEQALEGCRIGIVVQQGLQRGAIAIFKR